MSARRRAVGLTALIGFLAVTAWAAGIVPSNCCSATCESCPITFCKGTAADASPKVDLAPAPAPNVALVRFGESAMLAPEVLLSIPHFQSHAFRRPMRN